MPLAIDDSRGPAISSTHPDGPAVLFADGAVFRISPAIDPPTLRAVITIDGGEEVRRDELLARKLLSRL